MMNNNNNIDIAIDIDIDNIINNSSKKLQEVLPVKSGMYVASSKYNYYCSNCNKRGHTYKRCNDSIISSGIISFYIEGFNNKFIPLLEEYIKKNIDNYIKYIKNNVPTNDKIKFLMIQRKHSLGYIEFMRGRYDVSNKKNIIYLLEQMSPTELKSINSFSHFETLWTNLWNCDINLDSNKYHRKEFLISKQKFEYVRINYSNLFYKIKSNYIFNEWGFPKGRRELYETDIVCAMREFEEETALCENDYKILNETFIIKEHLIGTNGVDYKHNYFLALSYSDKIIKPDISNTEIGDIILEDVDKCVSIIRPYHKNKITIIKKIHNLIANFMIEYKHVLDEDTNKIIKEKNIMKELCVENVLNELLI